MKRPLVTPICFAIASYAVAVTSLLLACGVWVELFTIPRGTAIRPMLEAAVSLVVATGGTVIAFCLAVACLVTGRTRVLAWVAGLCCIAVALVPFPAAICFSIWVVDTQGLTLKP